MEGIYVGKVKRSVVDKDSVDLVFVDHRQDITHFRNVIKYDDTAYCLVPSDDVITTNDELLRLREQVKQLEDECNEWKVRYAKANNQLFQKGLAYGTLETTYKNEKIAGELLLKDRDALKEKVGKLEAELTEIKTARTLREAYVTGVEKGCESLREDRDLWKRRWNTVVTDISKSLEASGIEFVLKEIHGDGNWDVVIDIPELNETKKKVEDLEKKLAASKSNETFWRDRKEEEEDYHHYWLHTYDRVVKQAADKGIHIGVCGTDEDCNAGVVVVDNMKAEELEKQVVQMEDANQKLRQRISAADEEIEELKNSDTKHEYNKKWQAMLDALKDKGVEVIYMGEQDGKPCVDIKIPGWEMDKQCLKLKEDLDDLKKELEALKSRTLDNVEIRLSCGDIVWTYCDGFVHVSSGISGTITADEITTGTVPKCSSCAHYMHNPSRFAHDWCYKPLSKEGPGTIRKLSKEEVEGPACSDFKAKKE